LETSLTISLLKKKLYFRTVENKRPDLRMPSFRLPGSVLKILLNKQSTVFELSDFVKTSKKQRSNITEAQVKDIVQYNFIGICIAQRKDMFYSNTSFLIRNTFDRFPYELSVPLFSPLVDDIIVVFDLERPFFCKRNRFYYLRKKPAPMSTIIFDYVIDLDMPIISVIKDHVEKNREFYAN
jgi:ribosomal protein L19